MPSNKKIVFFGTPEFAVIILDELKKAGILPALIVTAPDKPAGRGLALTPPPVKLWATQNSVEFLQPLKLNSDFTNQLKTKNYQLFLVAAYGQILPKSILNVPEYGVLNVHPSLLPKFRGPTPVESAILAGEKETGVSIMLLDEEVDHGPLLRTASYKLPATITAPELEKTLARLGGELLSEIIPAWLAGKIKAEEQDHAKATFTKKITKENGLLDLSAPAEENYRKYLAYYGWPGVYFFIKRKNGKDVRVSIKEAELSGNEFVIKRVLPEGGREMGYADFLRGL